MSSCDAIGVAGNLYGRFLRQPAAVPVVPALVMLLPASVGVRSIATMIAHDVVSGMELAFTVIVLATALAAGLLLANLVVPPRRAL